MNKHEGNKANLFMLVLPHLFVLLSVLFSTFMRVLFKFLGIPRIDKLEIEGRGFHTNLYAVRGIYSGGKEGKSRIQWLRSMVGSPDLISIPGKLILKSFMYFQFNFKQYSSSVSIQNLINYWNLIIFSSSFISLLFGTLFIF